MKMPTDREKTNPGDDQGTLSAGVNAGTTDGDTPQKYVIDGQEFSADEIKEGLEARKNRDRWRSELDKKGGEINALKRTLMTTNDNLLSKISDIDKRLATLNTEPEIDPSSIADPDERREAEIKRLKREQAKHVAELKEVKQLLAVAKEQDATKERQTHWLGVMTDVAEKHGKDFDEKGTHILTQLVQAKMGQIPHDQWTDEMWDEAARISAEELRGDRQRTIDNYGKDKGKKEKTGIGTGSTNVTKRPRITAAMTQEERLAAIAEGEGD